MKRFKKKKQINGRKRNIRKTNERKISIQQIAAKISI